MLCAAAPRWRRLGAGSLWIIAVANPPLTPTGQEQRLLQLDVLRGAALFGILLMNLEGLAGPPSLVVTGVGPTLHGADALVDALVHVLVEGKFYTLFSLLFGAGFAVILQRAEARGRQVGWLYLRRLLVLAGFGLLHGLYVWAGDILLMYALGALPLLLFFRRTPATRAIAWGLGFYLLPTLFLLYSLGPSGLAGETPDAGLQHYHQTAALAAHQAELAAQRAAYGPEGDFAAANAQRAVDFGQQLGYLPWILPSVLGMFLVGVGLLRAGVLADPLGDAWLLRRLRGGGFLLGLPLVIGAFVLEPSLTLGRFDRLSVLGDTLRTLGALALCLAYMATLLLALQQPRWRDRLALLAPAGQMALSNYLLQSLACVALFYGYGFGAFEQLPRAWQPLFAVLLFTAQLALSRWWLARFHFGPAEWLWRALTYLQWPPLRR